MKIATRAQEIHECGYATIEALFGPAECREMREQLDKVWRSRGAPARKGFGFNIHPLLPVLPDLGRFLIHPAIMEVLGETFGEPAKIMHAGARISDETSDAAIGWHVHYSWDAAQIPQRARCERVLTGIYVDGSNAASGPLTVIPRRYNEPLGVAPIGDDPREIHVEMPPGSVVIFDTALWHRAKRGNKPGVRNIFGTHCQPGSDLRAHPEDNEVGTLASLK